MSDTPTTPTSDYGEPWSAFIHDTIVDKDNNWTACTEMENIRDRIVVCVNACAGIADPAKEIASLRGERDCLNRELSNICRVADAHTADEACEVIRAMRDKIKQAAVAIDRLTTAAAGGMQPANAKQDAIRFGNAVLTEFQPFITP
jgi:hypothetical protein